MLTNIALGAYTYNSSAYYISYYVVLTSYWAVDGKTGLNDSSVSCSVTVPGFEPHWIGVDMGSLFSIVYVILYAGTNETFATTKNDLNFFIVGVSNRSLDVHPPVRGTYDLCAQYPGVVASKQVVQLNCSSTTPPARYVILQQPSNSTGYMSVCEFEVYGTPYGKFKTNLLLKSLAEHSSSFFSYSCGSLTASLVVDGFHDTCLSRCHCGHTNDALGGPNWFMFDMTARHFIDYIALTTRGWEGPPANNNQLALRTENLTIGLTDAGPPPAKNNYPVCGRWPGPIRHGGRVEMKCNANLPKHRYLIAQGSATASDGHFTLCELEAYEPADENLFVWKRQSNKTLVDFQFKQLYVRSALDCMHKCKQLGGCDSINFHPASKMCQFNSHLKLKAIVLSGDTMFRFLCMIFLEISAGQGTLTNIALGTYTRNSSAFVAAEVLTSYFAVDGRSGLNDSSVLCSVTVPGFKPHWIGIDLASLFSIIYVVLYAGANVAEVKTWNYLNFFIVGVSNRSLDVHPPVGGTYELCAQYPGVVAPKQVVQLNCSSTTPPARYVILQQPSNSTGYMSVCEFEVYGIPFGDRRVNLLLKKPANQSSAISDTICGLYIAAKVVDGFHDTNPIHCHCGHTLEGVGQPNWYVFDMGGKYHIDYIALTARRWDGNGYDDLISHRLDNFIIGLNNVDSSTSAPLRNKYPMCATWPGYVKHGIKVELKCNANLPKYRYLIAQGSATASDGFFAICELEAYEPVDENSFRWKRKSNMALAGFQFKQLNVRSALDCMHKCKQLGGCDSINFHPASKLCQFNSHVNGYYTTTLTSDTNWTFYTVNYS
ncbi:hypothetical protein HELRODRAFT_175359 [Helobdella robusta]|uniref:Apple domain-containing protein n=1 Tax=Helobdella robusta TaxID=6412 RepID=T1F970_HELRO|nr:hypothetical protein HELRODRAFT_175359 [Helobdella robusta]ESO00864.1 hypothetical protein HELRODRAFT_175359 [Helobdella robusta]